MKKYLFFFWKGLTGILAALAEWVTVILGMKDDSKYGVFTRRIVGTCFAILVFVFTLTSLWTFCEKAWEEVDCKWFEPEKIDWYDNQELSNFITYHKEEYGNNGYLFNQDKKKILKSVAWIAKPLGEDSLVCYSDGHKRGYFNMYTGKVAIKPSFSHAWIFSDGLASVDDNGWIKFIDHMGNVVIDNHIPFRPDMDGYVFHNGHCIIQNEKGDGFGLIDKQGKWALLPEYKNIESTDSFWIVSNGKEKTVLNACLQTVIPFMNASIWINGNTIEVTMADHTIRTYSLSGEIIEDFHISEVSQLYYDTNEILYNSTKQYDDEGNLISETNNDSASTRSAIAHCRRYQAEYNWYGLMTPDGHVITSPSYSDITAIGQDLYLCKTDYEHGIIIDGKGNRVK